MSSPTAPEPATVHDVVIVGTGFSGICMAIKLREAGLGNFVILERADDVGGTWRDNDYPGCACDIPSPLYSFSFEPKPDWSRLFPSQPEIRSYLNHCVDAYGLRPYMRFGANVDSAVWDEASGLWTVDAGDRRYRARALVLGVGGLSRPRHPALPGLERFGGVAFHSAEWRHDVDLAGQRVAVIGTGASAIQFVPQIVGQVGELTLFQRTPPWVVPKMDRRIFGWEQWLYRKLPLAQRLFRAFIYWRQEFRGIGFTVSPRLMAMARRIALKHLEASVPDPALRARLTPDYTIGCKRILISNDYYPALQRPNLTLVTSGIRAVERDAVIDGEGRRHPVDVLIFGTGFHATDPLSPTRVSGTGGRELARDWRDGPEAFLGISVSGYPNLFLLMGPNTGLGHNSMVFMIEAQARYAARMIREIVARNETLDVRHEDQAAYNAELQRSLEGSVWASGCNSWYQADSGRQSVLWPGFTFSYWLRTRRPDLAHYRRGGRPAE